MMWSKLRSACNDALWPHVCCQNGIKFSSFEINISVENRSSISNIWWFIKWIVNDNSFSLIVPAPSSEKKKKKKKKIKEEQNAEEEEEAEAEPETVSWLIFEIKYTVLD